MGNAQHSADTIDPTTISPTVADYIGWALLSVIIVIVIVGLVCMCIQRCSVCEACKERVLKVAPCCELKEPDPNQVAAYTTIDMYTMYAYAHHL
jgi:hypothetical protein